MGILVRSSRWFILNSSDISVCFSPKLSQIPLYQHKGAKIRPTRSTTFLVFVSIACIIFISISDDEVFEESRGRIILEPDERNIKNAYLYIENVVLEDRKTYNCTGTNDAIKFGNANYTEAQEYIYVRVKGNIFSFNQFKSNISIHFASSGVLGKLAALWPFLGICAEVFVLCAIILIYEKRRNKAELEESDTDQSPEQ